MNFIDAPEAIPVGNCELFEKNCPSSFGLLRNAVREWPVCSDLFQPGWNGDGFRGIEDDYENEKMASYSLYSRSGIMGLRRAGK